MDLSQISLISFNVNLPVDVLGAVLRSFHSVWIIKRGWEGGEQGTQGRGAQQDKLRHRGTQAWRRREGAKRVAMGENAAYP